MKLLMVICPEARRDQVMAMVEKHGVRSFTELPQVLGEGITGKRLGTHVWPGKSVLFSRSCRTTRRMNSSPPSSSARRAFSPAKA